MARVTEATDFLVQYEVYSMDHRGDKLLTHWINGTSHDHYAAAVRAMGDEMRDHSHPQIAYKYGKHRIVRRRTTIVDDPLYFPKPSTDADRITLATPLKAVQRALSTRLYNVLQYWTPHADIGPILLAHVVVCDADFWIRQQNMGRGSLAELEAFLRDNDLPELGTLPIEEED